MCWRSEREREGGRSLIWLASEQGFSLIFGLFDFILRVANMYKEMSGECKSSACRHCIKRPDFFIILLLLRIDETLTVRTDFFVISI